LVRSKCQKLLRSSPIARHLAYDKARGSTTHNARPYFE
jgi:hypothetical protein